MFNKLRKQYAKFNRPPSGHEYRAEVNNTQREPID